MDDYPRVFGGAVRRWRTPLTLGAAVAIAVVVALPFSAVRGPEVPGFTAAWCTIVLLGDAVGVALLVGLYRNGRGLRMLIMALAFGWSGIVIVALALTIPGVVSSSPWIGTSGSDGWAYVSRHVGPPLLIGLALAPWPASWERREFGRRLGRAGRLVVLAVVVIGPGSMAAELVFFPEVLPRIVDAVDGHFQGSLYTLVLALNVGAVLVSILGVVSRNERSGVEVWAIVAAFAWLGDVAFVGLYEDRYTVAYYGSRLLGVLASMIVPASILLDTWWVHQRLTAGTADLEEQVQRLLEAQRVRDHVAAVVSHDMRTPLEGLYGYLSVLVDDRDLDPALVRRMNERSLVLTRRLKLLTEDLLAATTLEHTDLVLTPTDLDLSDQLTECASAFPDLDLRIRCPRGVQVHADPLRLQQILSNLVRNAQKHGAEPVTIDVGAGPRAVTLRVCDAGEGVPASFIPRLFERYSQGARTAGGAGIGLSVVHDLVQAHGGTISYDLTGPAFIVSLPVGAPAEPRPEGRVLTAPQK